MHRQGLLYSGEACHLSIRAFKSIEPVQARDRAAQGLTPSTVMAHLCSCMSVLNTCHGCMQQGLLGGQAGSLFIWVAPCVVGNHVGQGQQQVRASDAPGGHGAPNEAIACCIDEKVAPKGGHQTYNSSNNHHRFDDT